MSAGGPDYVLPEITDEMMGRAVFTRNEAELDAFVRYVQGQILRLDKDVAEALQATGSGWEQRGNTAIREWLSKQSA